jgi:membrane associated rhomboid family serine protease
MYEYKQLFSRIGSRNEYIKIAVFLIFVAFLLFPVLGKKAAIIVGAVALVFACLGAVFRLKAILSARDED